MAILQSPKRLRAEDFSEEEMDLVNKLAYVINVFNEDVFRAMQSGLGFDNLNQEYKDVEVRIDGSGDIINASDINNSILGKVQGVICIKADNVDDPTVYPTAQPWVSWTISSKGGIGLLNISGLQNNSTYKLRLLLLGS